MRAIISSANGPLGLAVETPMTRARFLAETGGDGRRFCAQRFVLRRSSDNAEPTRDENVALFRVSI
jgi:hypothetical protein